MEQLYGNKLKGLLYTTGINVFEDERNLKERIMCKHSFFHPMCLRLPSAGELAFERLGSNYETKNGCQ